MIVQWNANQFLVVEGVSGSKVYLNDPGTGPRTISPDRVRRRLHRRCRWNSRRAPPSLREEWSPAWWPSWDAVLHGLGGTMAFVGWISLMLVLPGMIVPGMTAVFVDNILIRQFEGWLGPMLIGLAVVLVVNIALRWLQGLALLRMELRLALEQSAKFTWHVLSLPITFFNQRYTGDLVNRVEANDRVATLLARDFGNAAAGCLTAGFLGAVMIFYDVMLAAIVLGGAALNIVALRLLRRVAVRRGAAACRPSRASSSRPLP